MLAALTVLGVAIHRASIASAESPHIPHEHRASSIQSAAAYKAARLQARLQQEERDNWDWFALQKDQFPNFKPTSSDQLVFDPRREYLPHSSFEYDKACYTACQPMSIPVRQCQGLFALGQPLYFKIDIEERHYTCVQSLLTLQPEYLPKYISWEMHELALQQPFPLLDTQLILTSWKLGYTGIKIYENNGNEGSTGSGSFSGVMPEDTLDAMTLSTHWRTVQNVLQKGIPDARLLPMNGNSFSWWDFHMRLGNTSSI
ncbi:hypothetical protein WJX74_010145 [Apatococcus lobatus]|uniref:Uncharacterized protein n=1 Tax=Apatococcus lobatus TaxID=904363 RepID=A0AAW1Q5X6_9CHLO